MRGGGTIIAGTLAIAVGMAFVHQAPVASSQQQGPAIVPRDPSNPSIHEGPSGRQAPGFRKDVTPFLGLLPASYDWLGGVVRAIGSIVQPFAADPTLLGQKSGQFVGYDFWGAIGFRRDVSRLAPGAKGIGGKNVTDVARLGQVCGSNPGDPYWVGYPRLGNTEFPPPYQLPSNLFDCFCRCDEEIDCPVEGPYKNAERFGGTYRGRVNCRTCFGDDQIRKHDKFVGTNRGSHAGYDLNQADPGYQECLRQSVESFAGSGPGGPVIQDNPPLYGL